jgi:hypothetical protein
MEICNLCDQPIKSTDKVVIKPDMRGNFHHKECWDEFWNALQERLKEKI